MDSSFLAPSPSPGELNGTGRARALELLGAYLVDVDAPVREASLRRVANDVTGDPRATLSLLRALAEYAATLAEAAAAASSESEGTVVEPAAFVRALARVDLTLS